MNSQLYMLVWRNWKRARLVIGGQPRGDCGFESHHQLHLWACSSFGRALDLHSRGKEFDPLQVHQDARSTRDWLGYSPQYRYQKHRTLYSAPSVRKSVIYGPLVKWLRHQVFILVTSVQLRYGSPI